MLSKVKKGAQFVERVTEKGGLSAIRSAGRKAHAEQASARAARDAEVAEQLAKLPPRSKKANEALGLYHPVGGGVKLTKPVSGMHATTVPDPMFNPPEIDIITPERLVKEEAALFPLVGDRAAAGKYLTHIGETELETPVRLTGGMRYMDANFNPLTPEESAAWESGLGRVTALGRQAARAGEGGRPVYGVYTAGSATNTDFNIMGANALIQQVPYSEISSKAEKEFDKAMREGSKKFPPLPDWPGIKSPEVRDLILDKNNGIIRTKLFDIMGKENFQSMGFPDVAATRKAIIEPELLDVETNQAGFRLAKMDPTGRIIENPLIPSDYPVAMAGQVAGRMDVPVDYQDIWQSHFDARRLLGQPESGDYYSFSRAHPIQYADDEWLNRLMEKRYQLEQKLKEGQAEGGAIDNDLKAWHEKTMAEGGAVGSPEGIPPLAMDLESDYQAYAAGGEVRMSNGGASEFEGFFESGLPPEPPAKEILVGRGVRRKEPRIGEIFETPAQAVQGALGAFGSAGKGALQATVGLPGDIISLGRGVGAAVSPQPGEDRLGAFLRGMEGETGLPTTEDVKKFLDQYGKAPFEQFETLGEFTGVPILAAPKVSGAIGRAAEDVAPYLRDLPVGASTKPVGQTTEEWLKSLEIQPKPQGSKMKVYAPADDLGLYSKMEKAALNFKRKEGTGDAWLADFKNAGVSDEELEFSGMKEILANMTQPRTRETIAVYAKQKRMPLQVVRATEGTDAGDFKFREAEVIDDTDYIKSRAEDIEADFDNEYPGGTDALRARIMQDFTDEELNDPHILASIDETVEANKKQEAYDRAYTEYYDNPYYRSYNDAGYEIIGNRDIGFTVKDPNGEYLTRNRALGVYPAQFDSLEIAESFANQHALDTGLMRESDVKYSKYQLDRGTDYEEMKIIMPQPPGKRSFHSSHWEDEEDVLSHYRTQRRVDTSGKEMLYVDEIQSDWHQAGRDYGYFGKAEQEKFADLEQQAKKARDREAVLRAEKRQLFKRIDSEVEANPPAGAKDLLEVSIERYNINPEAQKIEKELSEIVDELSNIREKFKEFKDQVPDAPFKDTWHELTVKTILHDAAQKGFERVGFSSAKPHIDRWGTEVFAWEKSPKIEETFEDFKRYLESLGPLDTPITEAEMKELFADKADSLYKNFKDKVENSGGWKVVSQEQRGGQAGGVNLEAEARARGILKGKTGQEIKTRDDLKRIVEDTLRDPTELKVERITNKVWKSMNKTDVGIHEPRKEGMQFFYDEALKKFLEKYANKIGGRFYETETKTGRGVSEEGPKDITEKVYMFEFTPEAKDTAVKGQPYKKGGLVKKDDNLIRWHKVQQLATGGAIKRLAESAKDKPWMKYAKSDKDKR
jgi:hypothetical protein